MLIVWKKLQREVKDILDELDIMLHVHKRQRDIMKRFRRHVEHILDPENRWSRCSYDDDDYTGPSQRSRPAADSDGKNNAKEPGQNKEEEKKKEQLAWFLVQYRELASEVDDRIDELEGLRAGAKSTAESVGIPRIHFV